MKVSQILLVLFGVVGVQLQPHALAEQVVQEPGPAVHAGIIRGLDFEANRIVVGGWAFSVPLDTPVTVQGTHSAFTLLKTGMVVQITYQAVKNGRVAVTIDQLPDNQPVPEY